MGSNGFIGKVSSSVLVFAAVSSWSGSTREKCDDISAPSAALADGAMVYSYGTIRLCGQQRAINWLASPQLNLGSIGHAIFSMLRSWKGAKASVASTAGSLKKMHSVILDPKS